METKPKLAILEIIACIFGWLWICASFAALYFIAMVIFSDGAWEPFFWALGVSVVSRWLAYGFKDNMKRVDHEENLTDKKYPPKNHVEDWPREGLSNKKNQSQDNNIVSIIQEYGKAIEYDAPKPGCVADENKLPFPKNTIKKAIISELKSSGNDEIKEYLKVAYIQLADWQQGVGPIDKGPDMSSIDKNQDIEDRAKAFLDQVSGSENWTAMAQKEQEALKQELQELGLW
ncbi:hypothetical protein [Desulfohalobium retbaense]|uniref:Uncharacterized protein n=1 Tax=Desulfohalobium retbaense (strain ATCC 49708 / DSM 5692 / JCM 16813 / HR100) TaxID=485915 RepID=C8X3A8_DESRD|nr:hypothetical protein [Desulfohalobium retbaense]ACV68905.1 hypothetical protein Dret_1621 [Desulfohalobium retbaense DSM 5692]